MTYEDTEFAMVSLNDAARECRRHGARLVFEDNSFAGIYDADNGDHWETIAIFNGHVSARAVLDALGY